MSMKIQGSIFPLLLMPQCISQHPFVINFYNIYEN